jgi:predicted  nucleic acid-binding Zn-ribbon protein
VAPGTPEAPLSDAAPAAAPVPTPAPGPQPAAPGQLSAAYPALRRNRLRVLPRRERTVGIEHLGAAGAVDAPPTGADEAPATIFVRAGEAAAPAAATPGPRSGGVRGRYRALTATEPMGSPPPAELAAEYRARVAERAGQGPAEWSSPGAAAAPDGGRSRLESQYRGLGAEPAAGRLAHRRRLDEVPGRIRDVEAEEAELEAISERYSREYTGRDGWTPGAFWDSVRYVAQGLGRSANRTVAVRRLRKARESEERKRQRLLCDLGEHALATIGLEEPGMETYHERLAHLNQEQAGLEDEIAALGVQIEETRREFTAAERELQHEHAELEGQLRGVEDKLRPTESDYRAALKKARAAEEDARALGRQIDHGRAQLNTLADQKTAAEEVVRLRAKVDRWVADRDGLQQEIPRLEERAAQLTPEIERLRGETERLRQADRQNREALDLRAAEHKQEVRRLQDEVERRRAAIEQLGSDRRILYLECGRQLDIDRPGEPALAEGFAAVDETLDRQRKIDLEIEIAQARPDPWDREAVKRAVIAAAGVVFLLSLLVVLVR